MFHHWNILYFQKPQNHAHNFIFSLNLNVVEEILAWRSRPWNGHQNLRVQRCYTSLNGRNQRKPVEGFSNWFRLKPQPSQWHLLLTSFWRSDVQVQSKILDLNSLNNNITILQANLTKPTFNTWKSYLSAKVKSSSAFSWTSVKFEIFWP